MVSQLAFLSLLVMLAVQRLSELRRSRRNEEWIVSQGGREHSPGHFVWMRALHLAWFASMGAEVLLLHRPFCACQATLALAVLVLGQWLRLEAMRCLGQRWSVRIFTLPGLPPVSEGIYRVVRHPNYLGVSLEIAGVPMIHGAYLTATAFTLLNALLLFIRIRAEERALDQDNDYHRRMEQR